MSGAKRDCQCPRASHRHGTRGAYQTDGCRCFPCRIAYHDMKVAYSQGEPWREGHGSLAGAIRRLQALHAVGWSFEALATHLGTSRQYMSQLANGKRRGGGVYAWTGDRIAALYDELWDRPPVGAAALRARLHAQRVGWVPPLAWDEETIDDPAAVPNLGKPEPDRGKKDRDAVHVDEIAIAEAMHGRTVTLTKAERAEVVHRLTERGCSAREIAERLGRSDRLVTRCRAKARAA